MCLGIKYRAPEALDFFEEELALWLKGHDAHGSCPSRDPRGSDQRLGKLAASWVLSKIQAHPVSHQMHFPAKITQRQTKRRGIAFDLTFCWQGVRYRPVLGYDLTPNEAQRLALKRIQEIQAGLCDVKPKAIEPATLQDAIQIFWDSFHAKGRIDEARPRGVINQFLLPFFGAQPLASLTAKDGLNYIRARQTQKASPGTIRREFQILNRILNLAVSYDLLDKNRLKAVDLPEASKRTRVVTDEELLALEQKASPELWRVILVGLNTGLREGKILELDRQWIRKERDGYWAVLPPAKTRTKGSPDKVPLNRIVLAATARDIENLDGGPIFSQWADVSGFRKAWSRACRRAKIHDLHFHDLRHSFVTRLQNLGVDYEVRQSLLGHRMPGMTTNYSHGGVEWDRKLREGITLLERALLAPNTADETAYERPDRRNRNA